jgi:hypothetical protein
VSAGCWVHRKLSFLLSLHGPRTKLLRSDDNQGAEAESVNYNFTITAKSMDLSSLPANDLARLCGDAGTLDALA